MSKHQIIYTSCMRGIDGVNDGQQIFSYDRNFDGVKNDEVRSLFTYQVPSLKAGVIMTEELALTMPAAFSFRLLQNNDLAISLNTYLGRDYMGSTGRFGNHLCHSIVCDFDDLDTYPCELYASSALRSSMDFDEVNNPNKPDYLPEPELEKGDEVDIDKVLDFLRIDENLEIYKHMLAAMLKFESERKRVLICDARENIIMWIAALEYALPLDIAKTINFTTYEYDPELSASRICGLIEEGSKYEAEPYFVSNNHFIFDFKKGLFSELEVDNDFIEFIDTAFSFSYESLEDFRDFVMARTSYRKATEDYYTAYNLYGILSEGLENTSPEAFDEVMVFIEKYTDLQIKEMFVSKLLDDVELINSLDTVFALKIIRAMLNIANNLSPEILESTKILIVDRLILSLSDSLISEEEFIPLYDEIDSLANSIDLNLSAELMKADKRTMLFDLMSETSKAWKLHFVIRVISNYVKSRRLDVSELAQTASVGAMYDGIIKMVYENMSANAFSMIEKILANFVATPKYLINMCINIECFLDDIPMAHSDKSRLWDYFNYLVMAEGKEAIDTINNLLLEEECYNEMFGLYAARIKKEEDFKQLAGIFKETYEGYFTRSLEYKGQYITGVLRVYEEAYDKKHFGLDGQEAYYYAKDLLNIEMKEESDNPYLKVLIQAVIEYMSYSKWTMGDRELLSTLKNYHLRVMRRKIGDKLLLLCIRMDLDTVRTDKELEDACLSISKYANKPAKLSLISGKELEKYLDYCLEYVFKFNLSEAHYTMIYNLFEFDDRSKEVFIEKSYKSSYKKSKASKDYKFFASFLAFIFKYGSEEELADLGKRLSSLSKKNLEEMDVELSTIFGRDLNSLNKWKKLKQIAAETNPLMNNLSRIFKRKN